MINSFIFIFKKYVLRKIVELCRFTFYFLHLITKLILYCISIFHIYQVITFTFLIYFFQVSKKSYKSIPQFSLLDLGNSIDTTFRDNNPKMIRAKGGARSKIDVFLIVGPTNSLNKRWSSQLLGPNTLGI